MRSKVNVKFWTVMGMAVLTSAFLMSCAGRKPFWGDPETGLIFQYQLSPGQVLTYEGTAKESQTMEMMGQNVETVTDVSSGYTIEGKGLDKKKNIKTEATFISMSMVSQGPQGENNYDTSSLIGKPFGVTFSPLGKELEYSGIDSTMVLNLGQGGTRSAKDLFRNPLQDLPDHPVKIGDTWTDSDSITVPQGGLNITIITKGTLTLKGFEEQDGFECAKIAVEGTGTIDGQGQQMGMDVALEGDIESHGTLYFAYKKGILVKSQSESFTEMTAALSGQMNMTIPISQESKSELKLSK